uniref:NADH dehydrogenase subunit 1 n=1 Tax=Rodentolepis nana TaxID=102285 RepID=A0A0R3TNL7_RODNA
LFALSFYLKACCVLYGGAQLFQPWFRTYVHLQAF